MKRPILKRTVKTIEVVTWTLEYEDVADSAPLPSTPPPDAMTFSDIQFLQTSFAQVESDAHTLSALFYTRLFELDPSLRYLFKDDFQAQGENLMSSLTLIVKGLAVPEKIVPIVRSLWQRHAGYGVRPEHFATVGEALLWTLAQRLGNAYTREVETAWVRAFGLVSGLMQDTGH